MNTQEQLQETSLFPKIQYHTAATAESETYPKWMMPKEASWVKKPVAGRSNVRGFVEWDFEQLLRVSDLGLQVFSDCHLRVPQSQLPFEPDIVLADEELNLFIDVEIDEPYDGYNRLPKHAADADKARDLFFVESGWVVVRFTEQQVRQHAMDCVDFMRDMLSSIREGKPFATEFRFDEECWTEPQAYRWEKEHYREKYLGIDTFGEPQPVRLWMDSLEEPDPIEDVIVRTTLRPVPKDCTEKMVFDEESHTYFPVQNPSGAADYESVTTVIGRFFPFDEELYVQQKARKEGRTEADVLAEFELLRTDASDRGTDMHANIEHFLKKDIPVQDDSKEFAMFLDFYRDNIQGKVEFADAEKKIFFDEFKIAGTADALFRKKDGSYIMVDWKRSKHLIIDGHPRKFGHGRGLSILSHLDSSSYYKYELQQSFYKYILELKYGMRLSAMVLVVLHPDYDRYYLVPIATYRQKEVEQILTEVAKNRL